VSSSYRFITSEATNYTVVDLCRALGGSRSGCYEWAGRLESKDDLAPRVSEVFRRRSRRYGSRRIAAELQAESKIEGERIGRRCVSRLMRELELEAIQQRRFVPRTTDSRHGQRMSPNLLLERAIKVDRPRQVIVGDITFLPLQGGGWAYFATWMDLFSRKIIGWQVADSMTAELVIEAIKKANLRERLPVGLIVHSDRGGQYVDTDHPAPTMTLSERFTQH